MRGDRYIVRSAVPYSVPLGEILAADREFLWFMLGVTLLWRAISPRAAWARTSPG
jgi:two-component system OmpR family sensor kinase